jgi:hypothetical protein
MMFSIVVIHSTSGQEVMTILVEGVQTVKGLRRIKNKILQFLHKCNPSHAERFMHSYPTRRVVFSIHIPFILYL